MIDFVFLGLVIFAAVYWLAAFASVVLYRRRRPCTSDVAPSVTILKPLRGNDGQLYENLRSFCLQDYRSFEIVFGVRDLHDPAVPVVERLRHEFPGLELKLVADSRTIGTNSRSATSPISSATPSTTRSSSLTATCAWGRDTSARWSGHSKTVGSGW